MVVALAEAGPGGAGEAALEAFAEGSTYYAALSLEADNIVASPTQMSAHSDLTSSFRSLQVPSAAGAGAGRGEGTGGRGVAGIASQLLGVWEAEPGWLAVALEVAVPPLSVRGQSWARLEVRQYVAVEDCLYSGLEIGMPASRRGGGSGESAGLRTPGRAAGGALASPKSPWPSLGLSSSITQQVLHQGAARVATLARRWQRRVQVAAPLAVTSHTQSCGPERLLNINLSNELAADLSVSSIHLQCVPGGGAGRERGGGLDSVVMSYLGERPTEEAPVCIPSGVQHSFVIRPVVLDARGLPSQDRLDVVSCFVTCSTEDCQSCVVYQHAVNWEEPPEAPLKVALTVGGQRVLESGQRVLDLRISAVNLSGEDKTLRLMTARSLGGSGSGGSEGDDTATAPATPGVPAESPELRDSRPAPPLETLLLPGSDPAFFLQSCIPLGCLRDRESREVQCELVVADDPGVVRIEDFWIKDGDGRTYSLGSELCVLCE